MKERITNIEFNRTPEVKIRVIKKSELPSVVKNKKEFPFELVNDVKVKVETTQRRFSFIIQRGYCWNGADIPRALFLFGQSKDNNYLIASMVHDYMLEYRGMVYNTVLNRELPPENYRRLTSLIFREILKLHRTNTVKANVMSFMLDFYQKYCRFRKWKI